MEFFFFDWSSLVYFDNGRTEIVVDGLWNANGVNVLSWPQFTLRPKVLVRVRQVNTKVFKFPFMSKSLFLSKPYTRSLSSLDTESTDFIGKF